MIRVTRAVCFRGYCTRTHSKVSLTWVNSLFSERKELINNIRYKSKNAKAGCFRKRGAPEVQEGGDVR